MGWRNGDRARVKANWPRSFIFNTFFYSWCAEANENAIKAASSTGRQILRYRSYHGATNATMQLTGDPRRLANEPGMPRSSMDQIHTIIGSGDGAGEGRAEPYDLEEVIMYEGPDTIAAMFVETVTGTNGIVPPPAGYMQGLCRILDKYGFSWWVMKSCVASVNR